MKKNCTEIHCPFYYFCSTNFPKCKGNNLYKKGIISLKLKWECENGLLKLVGWEF